MSRLEHLSRQRIPRPWTTSVHKNAASKTLTQVYLSSRLQVTRTAGNQRTITDDAPFSKTYDRGRAVPRTTDLATVSTPGPHRSLDLRAWRREGDSNPRYGVNRIKV